MKKSGCLLLALVIMGIRMSVHSMGSGFSERCLKKIPTSGTKVLVAHRLFTTLTMSVHNKKVCNKVYNHREMPVFEKAFLSYFR